MTKNAPPFLDLSEEWDGSSNRSTGAAGYRQNSQSAPTPTRQGHSVPAPGHHPQRNQGSRNHSQPQKQGGRIVIRGSARAVQQRSFGAAASPTEILSLRVERFDSSGNRLDLVPVELRGSGFGPSHIRGQVSDGDEVEVCGIWQKGILRAERIINLSTGAQVEDRSGWQDLADAWSGRAGRKIRKALWIAVGVAVALITTAVVVFALLIYHANSSFDQHERDTLKHWCQDIKDNGMKLPSQCRGVV
jgi:hypothetical protein